MNNDILFAMFASTLSKMNENELTDNLAKAKSILSEADYENLISFINQEKQKNKL